MALSRLALVVVLWVALAASSATQSGEDLVTSIDSVNIDSILKPNLKDPINVMERNIRVSLETAEDQVEADMPKQFTNAATALEHTTDMATHVKLKQQAKIQDALMKKTMPVAPELGEAQVEKPEQVAARNDQIRSEVLAAIDPDMRASLKHAEKAGSNSFEGMQQMIETAMDSKMKDLGQSNHQKDELGEGIEDLVHQKRDAAAKRAHVKASVNIQLAHAMKKLKEAQGDVELLETEETDPCHPAEVKRKPGEPLMPTPPLPASCKEEIALKTPKVISSKPHIAAPVNADVAKLVPDSAAKMNLNSTSGNSSSAKFSDSEIKAEVDAIRNHTLSQKDKKKAAVKMHSFKQPLPQDHGPKPGEDVVMNKDDEENKTLDKATPAPAAAATPAPAPAMI